MKKAWVEGEIVAVIIIVLVIFVLIIALSLINSQETSIRAAKINLNKDMQLINILRTPIGDLTLRDIIIQDYYSGDFELSKNSISEILSRAFYIENPCWELRINELQVARVNEDCQPLSEAKVNLDGAKVKIPINANIIEVRLYHE